MYEECPALLQMTRIRTVFQHFHIMIGFEHQSTAAGNRLTDGIGHKARIRKICALRAVAAARKGISVRVNGIMRYAEALHLQITAKQTVIVNKTAVLAHQTAVLG